MAAILKVPSVTEPAGPAAPAPAAGPMPRREERAFIFFACWIVSGLFLDGWWHNHHRVETFFTPWHALLYSGFIASTAWGVMDAARYRRLGVARPPVAGEGLTAVGVALFGIGMVGDFIWHTVFGIEKSVEALLSPTHLTLMTGGLLLATGPLRAAAAAAPERARTFRTFLPVLMSAAVTAALAGFFLQYVSAFRGVVAGLGVSATGHAGPAENTAILGVASVLITNALFLGCAAALLRSWKTPFGSLAFVFGLVALLLSALDSFDRGTVVLSAVAAGAVADLLVSRGLVRWVMPVVPLVMWPAWFGLLKLTGPMLWSANFWAGTTYLAVLTGVGVNVLTGVGKPSQGRNLAVT
jgi:hypothetical protein